jgi:hypothetical protein
MSPELIHHNFFMQDSPSAFFSLQYSHDISHGIFFKQGVHGHLDGMGQRRPIQVAVQTCLQFLNRDGM